MRRAASAAAFVGASGVAWTLAGVVIALLGAFASGLVRAQLPQVTADSAAVGGAAVALGAAICAVGLAHLGSVLALRRAARGARAATTILAATMAALLLASGVAAFVSAGTASGPAGLLLGAGIGLTLWAVAYAWAALRLVDAQAGGPV